MTEPVRLTDSGATIDTLLTTVKNSNLSATNKITRSATVVVAASDSSAKSKAQADYVCDGTADNVEIQAAIDSLSTTGGIVFLAHGTFAIASDVVMKSSITLEGSGFSTILKLSDTTYKNIISGTNINYVVIKNLMIDGHKTHNTYQNDENLQNGILVDQWYRSIISNVLIQNCAGSGMRIKTQTGTSSSKSMYNIFSNIISKDNLQNGMSFGVWAEYMQVNNCSFSGNALNGIYITTSNITFSNCLALFNTVAGLNATNSAKSYNNIFVSCAFNHNLGHGVYLNNVSYIILTSCKIIGNSYHGVWVADGESHTIEHNTITTNSFANENVYDNVNLSDGAYLNNVSLNFIAKGSGGCRYGINEITPSGSNIIFGNIVDVHATGAIVKSSTVSTVSKNIGYVTENTGAATITASATTVDVTHGLAAAPTRVLLSPTTATAGKQFYVSAKAASTFTITIDSAHSANISFDWQAVI